MKRNAIDLLPSELKAIGVHKYYMSQKEGREVSLEEAMIDFLINYVDDYLREKQIEDLQQQKMEIMQYKWIESEKLGRDIGQETAALQWVQRYGMVWREEREGLERNGFFEVSLFIQAVDGIRLDMSRLRDISSRNDCDLYVHKERIRHYNFILNGKKEYINVKSILCPDFLEIDHGESVELISTGYGATAGIEEAKQYVLALGG